MTKDKNKKRKIWEKAATYLYFLW